MPRHLGNLSREALYRRDLAGAHTRLLQLANDADKVNPEHSRKLMRASKLVAAVLMATPIPDNRMPQFTKEVIPE